MEQTTDTLDALDLRILDALQADASKPVAELAERLNSSKSVVWRRIQKLVERGVIRERVAVLDAKRLGLGVTIFAHVKMSRHGRHVLPGFVKAIKRYPQILECHTLMGNVDFLLKIVARDIPEYEQFFWQELSQIDGVQEISSSISMTEVISTTRLPIYPARGVAASVGKNV